MNKHLTFFLFFLFFTGFTTQAQVIQTIVGTGVPGYSGDFGPAISAKLNGPYGVSLDDTGNLYFCDYRNHCIRKISPARGGIITTIVGDGTPGYSGDGSLGIYAQLHYPLDVFVDHQGNVYIADVVNHCIRKVTPSNYITTIAGTGTAGYNGDGIAATLAQLNTPEGVTVDSIGNVYIADRENFRIRKIDTSGFITTVAGTGIAGYSSDGSSASTAHLDSLNSIRIDRSGSLIITDNVRIRRISPATGGIVTTIAGTGILGFSGDTGPATSANIGGGAIGLDNSGNVYLADANANRIRKINTSGIINTIAGSTTGGFGGDGGNPLLAKLALPQGVCVSNSGDVYIGDVGNNRIRIVTLQALALNDILIKNEYINIYPNPGNGYISIYISSSTQEPFQVTMTNVFGEKVKSFQIVSNQQTHAELDMLPGIYYLSATASNRQFIQKLVLQ